MEQVRIENVLGLNERIKNPLDLVDLGAKGIFRKQLDKLSEAMCLPAGTLASLLTVSLRTIQRQPKEKPFDRNVADRAIKLAELTAKGINVFGSQKSFCSWLQTPCLALGNKTPISLLVSTIGMEMVFDVIGRIEYGVFS